MKPSSTPAALAPVTAIAAIPSPAITPTKGFGPLLEEEHALQVSNADNLLFVAGPRASAIRRLLEDQQGRIAGGIGLVEKRVETLPYPERFHSLAHHRVAPADGMPEPRETGLAGLAHQHLSLQSGLLSLIEHRPAGGQPELLLVAAARNHEEMARMLTALLNEDDTVRDRVNGPIIAHAPSNPAEARWENEGGTQRPVASSSAEDRSRPAGTGSSTPGSSRSRA